MLYEKTFLFYRKSGCFWWCPLVMRLAVIAMLVLAGCTQMPISSMLKLRGVRFESTDISALRAGVAFPEGLRPLHGTAKLTVEIEPGDGSKLKRSFRLQELGGADARALADEAGTANIAAYRIAPNDQPDLEAFRHQVLAARAKAARDPSLKLSVAAEACRTGPLPNGALLLTTYLKTSETGRFVTLARGFDLRALGHDRSATKIAPCPE